MKTLLISDKDYAKAVKLLVDNGIEAEVAVDSAIPFLRSGNAASNEMPSSFGGIWATDERTMDSILKTAWPKRN